MAEVRTTSEQQILDDIFKLIDAGGAVIQLRSREVLRTAKILRKGILNSEDYVHTEWDATNGLRRFSPENYTDGLVSGGNEQFLAALKEPLEKLRDANSPIRKDIDKTYVYVFIDPHPFINGNPFALSLIQLYAEALPNTNVCVLFVTPEVELQGLPMGTVLIADAVTPSGEELARSLRHLLTQAAEQFEMEDLSEEDIAQIAVMGQGMTLFEFETYVSISMIESSTDNVLIDANTLLEGVAKGKTEVVKQSDILELFHTEDMGDVGGMHRLKSWVEARANNFTEEAQAYGIEPPKGVAIVGVPGCLAGDTIVDYKRGSRPSGRPIRLDDLYRKFNGMKTKTRPWVDVTMPTYLHSLSPEGDVFYNRIVSVIEAGEKECLKFSFEDGSELTLTPGHPICTPGGTFVPASQILEGELVLARGSMLPVGQGGRKLDARPPRAIVNLKYHPYGSFKDIDGYLYTRVARARLVVEAHMNGIDYDEFVHILKNRPILSRTFKYLEPIYEVHHVDEDTMNDEIGNLMVLHKVDHAREHGKNENFNVEYVKALRVTSVASVGVIMTYDVQMDMPANNFVANGVIVHNTGKSLVAKAIASTLGVPLIRLDFGRVFSKFIGDSESRMRSSLKMLESMGRVVLFADEIDKGLGGIGGGGDSGTSSRVLGAFLTWMQENKTGVFTILTANKIEGLPPELFRKGRMDAVFSVGLPNSDERREVLGVHLRKRGRSLESFEDSEIRSFLTASKNYTPAEIEAAVKDALIISYNDPDADDLQITHINKALGDMVPMSTSHADQIATIMNWAQHNATPVSYEEGQGPKSTKSKAAEPATPTSRLRNRRNR